MRIVHDGVTTDEDDDDYEEKEKEEEEKESGCVPVEQTAG